METVYSLWRLILTAVFLTTLCGLCDGVDDQDRQVHIVYMGALPDGEIQLSSDDHVNMLRAVIGPKFERQHLLRSYTRSFNAFAANLTEEERTKLSSLDGVVSVFPDRIFQPQTSRSWDFMGFPETVSRNPTTESDIIVCVIDTGIWPESESFSDEGFGPVPSKWKGACNGGENFTCNNKIVGARWYSIYGIYNSTRDNEGHGTHTASTAAGNSVKETSFYGLAKGTARGAVPSARIASYKVCGKEGCSGSDILAGFDDAIADKCDMMSVSLGPNNPLEIYYDPVSIGGFHAMQSGMLTVQAAGNSGTDPIQPYTTSVAPWLLTVAASSTDRRIINKLVLGNATTLLSSAIDTFKLDGDYPLVSGKEVADDSCSELDARFCTEGCLNSDKVKGKIVRCDSSRGLKSALEAGATGVIVPLHETDCSFVVPMPAALISLGDMKLVEEYMNSTKKATAQISVSEVIPNPHPGVVSEFSSKGPNVILPDILKPDCTAPGMEILAAFSPLGSVSGYALDKRSVKYNILSGTSMSCPHVTGAAAYVKSFHPDWSPSAIKSALMTTARELDPTKNKLAEFDYGAGHIDPVKAANPGLVYETTKDDYVKMVCSLNYDPSDLKLLFGGNVSCPTGVKVYPKDLNYPSMSARVDDITFTVDFQRTVTNVGVANSTYKASITKNPRLDIKVEPTILSFKSLNEKQSFVVTVSGMGFQTGARESAALIWSDGDHSVRTPVVMYHESM